MYDITKVSKMMNKAPSIRNYGGHPMKIRCGDFLYSYNTAVAWVKDGVAYVPTWHSTTTTRHINQMADEMYLEVVKLY